MVDTIKGCAAGTDCDQGSLTSEQILVELRAAWLRGTKDGLFMAGNAIQDVVKNPQELKVLMLTIETVNSHIDGELAKCKTLTSIK